MNERLRVFLLTAVMAAVTLVVAATTILLLYRTSFEQEKQRLVETVQSQARILEEIYKTHLISENNARSNYDQAAIDHTLRQIVAAHSQYKSASPSEEFTLAKHEGDQIVFYLLHRENRLSQPRPMPWKSNLAEPMRRALSGKSGTVVALDYKGTKVLAAFEPVPFMHLGIVAKVDLAEVRAPFVKAGLVALLLGVGVIFIGVGFFIKLTNPILRKLADHGLQMEETAIVLLANEQRLRTIIDSSVDGILVVGRDGIPRFANPAAEELFDQSTEELLGANFGLPVAGKGQADIEIMRGAGQRVFASLRSTEITWQKEPCFLVTIRDISERKKNEERIHHLNSVLAAVRNVNQLITREKDRGRLIQIACETLIETRGFNSAWIILLDEAGRPDLAGGAGLGEGFAEFQKNVERGELPPCSQKTLSQPEPVIIDSVSNHCGDCPLAFTLEDRVRISIRLEHDQRIFGLLASTMTKVFADDPEEKALFQELAGDIALALFSIEQEEERRAADRQVFESEERLRAIFEAAVDVGFIVTDLAGEGTEARILEFSPGAKRCFGYTREEVIGKSAAMLNLPENVQRFPEVIATLRRGEPGLSGETTQVRKSGEAFPALYSVHPLRDADGQIISILAVIIDISEQKETEEKLRVSEERFKALFELAPDAYCLIDFQGKLVDANKAAEDLVGVKKEDVIGKSFNEADLVPAEEAEKVAALFAQTLQGKSTEANELVLKRKDGRLVFIEVTALPTRIEGRDVLLGTARDVTERKELEKQLQQAQRLEVVGRLSGGIAHDFNNLMTTVIGNTELMLMNIPPNDPLREDVLEIKKAGERATSLTHQLLAFSRRQILQTKILNLNEIVQEMDRMLRRVIGEDIDLETDLDPNLGHVETDPGQVEQILMNLAVNARDAMPEGGKLTLETQNVELSEDYARAHHEVTPGSYVMLAVSDNGMGMTAEVRANIFEPFFTTKELGKGTGLGLATVYGIVKQSGGSIWVYSEQGQGTTFKIYLPRVEKVAGDSEKVEVDLESLRGSETVLLVEDDEMLRNMTIKILQRNGYQVLPASDGRKALRLCQEHEGPIHLLLTDVVMPVMGGLDLSNEAKRLRPNLKTLFMSGYTDNAIVHRGILDKGVAFLQKPFTPARLARKLREVLAQRPS